MIAAFTKFLTCKAGNFAVTTAVMTPLVFGMGGLAMDYARFQGAVSGLQEIADSAALATVHEFTLSSATPASMQAIAQEYVAANAEASGLTTEAGEQLLVTTAADFPKASIEVRLSYVWAPFFAQLFDDSVTPIKVSATARLASGGLSCVIGLMPAQPGGITTPKASIHLDRRARISAKECGLYSASTSNYSLRVDGDAVAEAGSICSSGGVWLRKQNSISPKPVTDCPVPADPLASRKAPVVGACNHTGLVVSSSTTLSPGVYCGGIRISGNAQVALNPGIYVVKDGPLVVEDQAALIGEAVAFYLTGARSVFEFRPNTTVSLKAMETGPLAGLLFFEDRNVPNSFLFNPLDLEPLLDANIFDPGKLPPELRVHRITSRNAGMLLGTIYLPKSVLLVDAEGSVAQNSPYTAIVTGRLWLRAGPILTLNANYQDTKVPVPGGLLGVSPMLVK